jgi:hypothetical protein
LIHVVLQKPVDIPFIAPLDVPAGVDTDPHFDNAVLRERYWTVFDPDALARALAVGKKVRPEPEAEPLGTAAAGVAKANGAMPAAAHAAAPRPDGLFDLLFGELNPQAFREAILSRGAVMLRNAVDPALLQRIAAGLNSLFDDYHNLPAAEFAARLADEDPLQRDLWEQVQRSHVFDRTFKTATGASYFDIVRESGLWDFAAAAFPESIVAESPISNCRRVADSELHHLWDKPVEFHVDAQVFYDDRLSINFWTPLVACGVDAPGLKVIPLGVAQTREYLEHNPGGYEPGPADIGIVHNFRCAKMDEAALASAALLQRAWAPKFRPGDVLAFTNFTMHATHYTPAMTQPRTSVEVRIDLPGYRFD